MARKSNDEERSPDGAGDAPKQAPSIVVTDPDGIVLLVDAASAGHESV